MQGEDRQIRGAMSMTQFFVGAPWVPRYKGAGAELKFSKWSAQIRAMLRSQTWGVEQQCDFIIGALEGEARQEIIILERQEISTPDLIFTQLVELCGDRVPIALLRGMFFDCRK